MLHVVQVDQDQQVSGVGMNMLCEAVASAIKSFSTKLCAQKVGVVMEK